MNESYGAYWGDATVSEWAFVHLPVAPPVKTLEIAKPPVEGSRACFALDLSLSLERSHKARAQLIAQHVAEQVAATNASLKAELEAYRQGGLTEEILRRNGGAVKVGRGCTIVSESDYATTQQLKKEIARFREALTDSLNGNSLEEEGPRSESGAPFAVNDRIHSQSL